MFPLFQDKGAVTDKRLPIIRPAGIYFIHSLWDGKENRRSEEHTSELQSRRDLVCRLLLEKKKANLLARPRGLTEPCGPGCRPASSGRPSPPPAPRPSRGARPSRRPPRRLVSPAPGARSRP